MSSNNKKMLASATAVSLLGATVVGSIIGGALIKNDLNKKINEAKQEAFNNRLTASRERIYDVAVNDNYTIYGPTIAKLSFDLPTDLTGKLVTLRYQKVLKENETSFNPLLTLQQFVNKQEIDAKKPATFSLVELDSNYKYNYDVVIDGQVKLSGSFVTTFRPALTATSMFRALKVNISNLGSYKNRTLILKAIPTSQYNAQTAPTSFKNSNLFQVVRIGDYPKEETNPSLTVEFNPPGLSDNTSYTFQLFDREGLLPLLDPTDLPNVSTSQGGLTVENIYGYINSASMDLKGLEGYQGTTLRILYQKINSETQLLIPATAQSKDIPVAAGIESLKVYLENLDPNSLYRFNLYSKNDTSYNEPLFHSLVQKNMANDFMFRTNSNAVVAATQTEDTSKSNPEIEARAVRIEVSKLDSFQKQIGTGDNIKIAPTVSSLKLKVAKKPVSGTVDWSKVELMGSPLAPESGKTHAFTKVVGLEPATEYVYQLVGADGKTTLLATEGSFTTLAGFTTSGVSIQTPLSTEGQQKSTVTFSPDQLAQFYVEPAAATPPASTRTQDSGGATTGVTPPTTTPLTPLTPAAPINQLELRYIKVENNDSVVEDWDPNTNTNVKKADLTIKKSAEGTYSIDPNELTGLTASSYYKLAIFMGPNKMAPVSDVYTFLTNTQIVSEVVATNNKSVLYLEKLDTYLGKEVTVTLTKKNIDDSVYKEVKTFVVSENLVESLEFAGLDENQDFNYKVTVQDGETPAQLLAGTFKTGVTEIRGEIPFLEVNPSSVMVKLFNLQPLSGKNLSIAYRVKTADNSNPWSFQSLSVVSRTDLSVYVLESAPGLLPSTEYEFNLVWEKAPASLLLKENLSATTKAFVIATTEEISQVSAKAQYQSFDSYKGQTLTLRYMALTEELTADQLSDKLRSSSSTQATYLTINVPASVNENTRLSSLLTGLQPDTQYGYMLFNKTAPISEPVKFRTEKQLSVSKVEAFASAFEVTFNNLNTVTGEGSDELQLAVYKANDTTPLKIVKFRPSGNSEQKVLVYDLNPSSTDPGTGLIYKFQVFRKTDVDFTKAKGIITTDEASDKRTVTLLSSGNGLPTQKVTKRSTNSVEFNLSDLSENFIGKTVVLKYRTSYWDPTLKKNVEVASTVEKEVKSESLTFILTDLIKNSGYFYEFFVKVGEDTDNVPLAGYLTPDASRDEFTTLTNIEAKLGKNFTKVKEAELYFVSVAPKYNLQTLVLKAMPKTQFNASTPNWNSENVISSATQKIEATKADGTSLNANESTEYKFNLSNLMPNTEYVYQVFVDGLNDPLLVEAASFSTKANIRMNTSELSTNRTRLLLSGLKTYANQKLNVRYWKKTDFDDITNKTTNYKDFELTVENSNELTESTLLPLNIKGLEKETEYVAEVYSYNNGVLDTTNLLETTLVFKTLTKDVTSLVLSNGTSGQAKVYLSNLGNLKGKELTLEWKPASGTANKIDFMIPTTHNEATFEVPTALTGIATSGNYTLSLKPKFTFNSFDEEVEELLASDATSFNAANLTPVVTSQTSFTDSDKGTTLASSLATKSDLEAKLQVALAGYSVSFQDNTDSDKTKISANDVEGKLFIKVLVTKTSTSTPALTQPSTEFLVEVGGFKKVSPTTDGSTTS